MTNALNTNKNYRLYAVVYSLKGSMEKKVEYVTSTHSTAPSVLKRKLTMKLKERYPESAINGGSKYFTIHKEQLLESADGWNRYSILPKEEE